MADLDTLKIAALMSKSHLPQSKDKQVFFNYDVARAYILERAWELVCADEDITEQEAFDKAEEYLRQFYFRYINNETKQRLEW